MLIWKEEGRNDFTVPSILIIQNKSTASAQTHHDERLYQTNMMKDVQFD